MSTITVTNIKATGETINRPVAGVAAAYADFNTTSNDTIEDSVNIASKTDNGHQSLLINGDLA